jgi:hypothetical protein
MASATVKVPFTMMTPTALGIRRRTSIRRLLLPIIFAACTNSRVLRVSTSARTSRETPSHDSSDSR